VKALAGHPGNHMRDTFAHNAQAGTLPAVSWVYGDGRGSDLSEHPKNDITAGSQWTADQIQAIVDGGLWGKVAIFVTWDDWGGWYDHVDPPVKERWDPAMAQRPQDAYPEFTGDPFRYGSRVPCLAISPYAKAGHVSSEENSHVSLLKFCERTFGLDALTDRDAQSNGMADCFDLTQAPLDPPGTSGPGQPVGPGAPAVGHGLLRSIRDAATRAKARIAEAEAGGANARRELGYAAEDVDRILSLLSKQESGG